MSRADKLFLICFAISLFLSMGIAGNIECDQPTPIWGIVIYILSTAYCILRILIFKLYEK